MKVLKHHAHQDAVGYRIEHVPTRVLKPFRAVVEVAAKDADWAFFAAEDEALAWAEHEITLYDGNL